MALSTITSPTSPRPLADVSQAGVCRRARVQGRARVATVPTVIFVRHGRSTSNTAGTLAGWMPGVFLDETGEAQAASVGQRVLCGVLARRGCQCGGVPSGGVVACVCDLGT